MADSTISQLPVALSVSASDVIPIDQAGVTKRTTLGSLGTGIVFAAPGKFLTINNTLTFQGTDGTTITFPTTSATMARTDSAQTFTGVQTFLSTIVGNINTASTLFTARTIDGVSFDGSTNITVIAPATHAAPSKTTPDDADEVPLSDSSATFTLAKVTWANIKATSKTYFDTLYAALAGSASQVFSAAAATAPANVVRLDQMPQFPFRNRIVNGDFAVSQLNGSNAVTVTAAAALVYVIDQFYAYCTGANVTGQRVAGTGSEQFVYQFTGAASVTKIGFVQRMETNATYDMNNGSALIGVSMSNSLLVAVNYNVWYANTADTFGTLASPTRTLITSGTLTVSSAYARQYIAVSVPAAATTGIEIEFNVGAQTSGTWEIGRVQFEAAVAAATTGTVFEQLPFEAQLKRCQRYLPVWNSSGAASIIGMGVFNTTTSARVVVCFPTQTRVAPTGIAVSAASHFSVDNGAGFAVSATTFGGASDKDILLTLTVAGATANTAGFAYLNNASGQLYLTGAQL